MRLREKFRQWLTSNDFYLHWGLLMIIASLFDNMATDQILYNNKQAFLVIEQNDFLLWSLKNNMWWVFALFNSMLIITAVALMKYGETHAKEHIETGRFILFMLPTLQFIQPLYAIIFLRGV